MLYFFRTIIASPPFFTPFFSTTHAFFVEPIQPFFAIRHFLLLPLLISINSGIKVLIYINRPPSHWICILFDKGPITLSGQFLLNEILNRDPEENSTLSPFIIIPQMKLFMGNFMVVARKIHPWHFRKKLYYTEKRNLAFMLFQQLL